MINSASCGHRQVDGARNKVIGPPMEKVDMFGVWVTWIFRNTVKDTRIKHKNDAPI